MIEYVAWSEILLFIGYEIENGSAKEDFWFQSNLFQNCFPQGWPWATGIRISLISLHVWQSDPHPLRAGHRETERESLLWGRSVFECRPHWLLHQTSGAQHHGVSGKQLRKNNTVSDFRNPNRVKPGGEEDEEEVCTMSRKRRWHNFKMKIARNQIKSKWRMFAKNCKQILKKCVCQE